MAPSKPDGPGPGPCVLLRVSHQVATETIWVEVSGTVQEVHAIQIDTARGRLARAGSQRATTALGRQAARQLKEYFTAGTPLDLPLHDHGDRPTQTAAMRFLQRIPTGRTRSYAEQASAVRAATRTGFNPRNAGTANRNNHYPLAIPCHRVVRTGGDVGGFMGSGQDDARRLKRALLAHERAVA